MKQYARDVCMVSIITFFLTSIPLAAFSFNPLTWFRKKEDKAYRETLEKNQKRLIDLIRELAKNYEKAFTIIEELPADLKSEEEELKIQAIQHNLVEYIKQTHQEVTNDGTKKKGDLQGTYTNFPCIAYSKRVSEDIKRLTREAKALENAFKEYKKYTDIKNYNVELGKKSNALLDDTTLFLINLTVLFQFTIYTNDSIV